MHGSNWKGITRKGGGAFESGEGHGGTRTCSTEAEGPQDALEIGCIVLLATLGLDRRGNCALFEIREHYVGEPLVLLHVISTILQDVAEASERVAIGKASHQSEFP